MIAASCATLPRRHRGCCRRRRRRYVHPLLVTFGILVTVGPSNLVIKFFLVDQRSQKNQIEFFSSKPLPPQQEQKHKKLAKK